MLSKLTVAEAKIFLRDPGAPAVVLGIPLALLVVFGLMPGSRTENGGQSSLATLIAPMAVAILLAILALNLFPGAMAAHREKGC
ncbi:hypothetical protein [Amycolatopsis sp. WGS_07]|uniref:hypothetical protein n=1 Tax=Amycolatopsis sp. WGS_07 TaxID=3076764 RepID=UPI003872CB82